MENKCLLFQSAVQSKFLTQEMVLAYLSRSLCVTTDSLPTQNDVDITWYLLFQAALCSLTCPLRSLYSVCSLQCISVRVRPVMPNGNQVFAREGSITLWPLLQTQEEGLVFLTLPHSSVWLSGRETLIGAPSPCRALLTSPLNGVLHYICYPWSSPVQGLDCMHQGWQCIVQRPLTVTSQYLLILQFAFCRVCHFLNSLHNFSTSNHLVAHARDHLRFSYMLQLCTIRMH